MTINFIKCCCHYRGDKSSYKGLWRRVELSAYPVLDQYHFDYWVPERQIISTEYVCAGSGVAGKPVGVSYTKTYRYL